jgi:hypothetical protein
MPNSPKLSDVRLNLFAIFSRFEFSLKEEGFLLGAEGADASPNWDKFANLAELTDIVSALSKDTDVAFLIGRPPKTQIVTNKSLGWRAKIASPITRALDLLLAVRTVRNNLFHGGKSGENPDDEQYCRAATVVLMECLRRCDSVRYIFEGKY